MSNFLTSDLISIFNNVIFRDDNVVSVIYFRAGYEPGHYPSKKEWDARLLMER